ISTEEVLTSVRTASRFERLVFTVDAFFHDTPQYARPVPGEQRVPPRSPDHLDDVPTGTLKRCLELLNDLAVASDGTIETLQVAVDHEDEVVELLAHRHGDRAHGLGLVGLPVAEEAPHLPILLGQYSAVLEVTHETRLEDGHHRPQPHRHGRELPEMRHEPRVRIGRQSRTYDLAA